VTGRARCAAVAVGAAVLLASCSPAQGLLGLQANTAVLSNQPAITAGQATSIAARALGQAQRADALRTPEAAETAFTGLELRVAPPRYVVERVLDPAKDSSGGALEPVVQPSRIIVTAGRAFPRTIVAVWRPQGSATQQVAVMDSSDVRTPFLVSARADLLPGATLPATAPSTRGASLLGPDVEGLVATPAQAVKDLALLLQTGRSGGTSFAPSVVVKDVRTKAAAQAKDVAKVAVFRQTHAAEAEGIRVVRTADGGAIVVAAIDRTDRFGVRKGAGVITPPPAYRALSSGLKKITRAAAVTTVQTVVLVLPPQGGGPAQVIGFSEVPVSVSGS
jgi:hypothetical protein